jgi:hypothetical protein
LQLVPDSVVARTESPFTGSQQLYFYGGERWRLMAKYPQLEPNDYRTIKAFLLALRNGWGTFYFTDPGCKGALGVATGTPVVHGPSQVGHVVVTRGWTASTTNILKAGDDIQMGYNCHTILQDANSDGSGVATLDIWPSLRGSPPDGTPIIVSNPTGIFRLEPGSVAFSEGANKIYEVGFAAVEAI